MWTTIFLVSVLSQNAAETKKQTPEWTGTLGFSALALSGNAESVTGNIQIKAERKTATWIWGTTAFATYGQTRVAESGATEVVALMAGATLRGDRRFSERFSVFLSTGTDTDHIKSVEWRYFGETGTGFSWLEVKSGDLTRLFLRTDLGFRYAQENRFQYYPTAQNIDDVTLWAPRIAVSFRYMWEKNTGFFHDTEVLPNVVGASRVLVNSTSKVTARLTDAIAIGIAYNVRYDSLPAAGKKPTDTALSGTVEVGF